MKAEIKMCQWILRDDHEAIASYKADGWEIKEMNCHHSYYSVLAVKELNKELDDVSDV